MCEQTEVRYLDGDVVWVKLGSCWWPGHVKDVDKLPEEILTSLRKKPIAAVKFFQEDTFEYVRNLNQICMYNCRRKNEYIKKGLDIYRTRRREGSSVMDKFPEDVAIAEKLTGGNPDILRDNTFAPEERPNYQNIFGGDKKTGYSSPEKKSKLNTSSNKEWKGSLTSSANGRRNQSSSPALPILQQPRQITHPRFISEVKDDSDHVVRIRHQPVTTPSPEEQANPSPQYKCHLCDFTSRRLNVIVLHNKFHSADAANNGRGEGVKGGSGSKNKSAENKNVGRGKGRTPTSSPSDRSRVRSRAVPTSFDTPKAESTPDKSAPKRKLIDECDSEKANEATDVNSKQQTPKKSEKQSKISERKSKTPIFGKRKGSKWGGERPAKKRKNDDEIREKLLADWDDEDEEQEEKEIELIKQELSKSELIELQSSDMIAGSTKDENVSDVKASSSEETVKPKETSCFDFDDAEDANLGIELEERAKKFVENRKIPRIIDDKSDSASRRRNAIENKKSVGVLPTPIIKEETVKEETKEPVKEEIQNTNTQKMEIEESPVDTEDMDSAFKSLLEETTVPVLPEVPELPTAGKSPPPSDVNTTSLPDVVLDSNNCDNVTDVNSSLPSAPVEESIETGGSDHDYSIKTDKEDTQDQQEETGAKFLKIEMPQESTETSKTSLEDDEIELDINSMPVVMTDAIITEEPTAIKTSSGSIPSIDLIPSSTESQSVTLNESITSVPSMAIKSITSVTTSENTVILPKSSVSISPQIPSSSGSTILKSHGNPIKTVKLQTSISGSGNAVAVSGASIATVGKQLKGTGGTAVISQKGSAGGKLVIVQTSPAQQSRYTVGKPTQQRVTQQQIVQQAVGGGKVVILTNPQGGAGQQKILTTALSSQQQRLLTSGKLQPQSQRIITSTGAILTPVHPRSVMAKGTKLTPITQQQIRTLQGGKQTLGTKFTMQSTQAKVILPTMPKTSVTQTSPVRVIGTLNSQSNTILIQTTQGTTVSGTVIGKPSAITCGQMQAKLTTTQSLTRLPTPKPKILSSPGIASSVQRFSLSSAANNKTQVQSKVLEIRPTVAPRMVVQKVPVSLPVKAGNVGLLTNVSQVKKSGIFPRGSTIQKVSQSTSQLQSVQKVTSPPLQKVITTSQAIKKAIPQQKVSDINISSKCIPVVVSPSNLQPKPEISNSQTIPGLQPLQPSVSVGPAMQQNVVLSSSPVASVSHGSSITLPSLQSPSVTATTGTSVLTPEQIAQVVAAAPTEQLGDSGTATYVLVTIDDSGALQPYDNSTLLTYDGNAQTNDGAARTLYIDPSSISTSGDLENIILTIDNTASSSGTVLNLGQSNTMPINPGSRTGIENSSSSVFNIGSSTESSAAHTGGSNQDILAEALANTQVFQSDNSIQDSLTVVNSNQSSVMTPRLLESSSVLTSTPSTLHQATMLLPSLSTVLPPPNPAGVLETSLTLNQPIMTPLEVPSSAVPTIQAPRPVPSSLELPLTITQSSLAIASQPFANLPVTASSHITTELPASHSNLAFTMAESRSATNFNPSMPLLSEDTETHCELERVHVASNSCIVDPSQRNLEDSSYNCGLQKAENIKTEVKSEMEIKSEELIPSTQDYTEQSLLSSYTANADLSHDDSYVSKPSELQSSLDQSNTCQQPLECSTDSMDVSIETNKINLHSQEQLPEESTTDAPIQSNISAISGTSESVIITNNTLNLSHSSSDHLALDQKAVYSQINTSQLENPLTTSASSARAILPFPEISESVAGQKSVLKYQSTDNRTLELKSEICESADANTPAEMKIGTSLSEQILDSGSTQSVVSYKTTKSSLSMEVEHSELPSGVEKQSTLYSSDNTSQAPEVLRGDVGTCQQTASEIPHSMPLLVDEPMIETEHGHIESNLILREDKISTDDSEITKKVKHEESER